MRWILAVPCCPHVRGTVSDVGFVPGHYTEALVDAGSTGTLYSGISINAPRETYFNRVDVAISDDRLTWREIRDDALIYRVADSGDPGSQTVVFSPARARWIRIRIIDRSSLFPIGAVTIAPTESEATDAIKRLDASATFAWRGEERASIVTLDLGTPNTRVSSLRFHTTQDQFSREVSIQTSDDGEHWDFAGGGTIARFAEGAPTLEVAIPQVWTRYVRAEISNGNDAPLRGLGVAVFGPRRTLVFVARPGRSYALIRIARAQPPMYDIGVLTGARQPSHHMPRRSSASVGARQLTRIHQRRPAATLMVTLTFAVVIVTLGAVTLSTLRPRN